MSFSKKKVGFILSACVLVAVVVSFALPRSQLTELDWNMARLTNLRIPLRDHAAASGGHFPRSLAALAPESLSRERLAELRYRDGTSKRTYDWLYFGESADAPIEGNPAIVAASPSSQICPKRMMHHRIVLFADTTVKILGEEEFQRRLAVQLQAHR